MLSWLAAVMASRVVNTISSLSFFHLRGEFPYIFPGPQISAWKSHKGQPRQIQESKLQAQRSHVPVPSLRPTMLRIALVVVTVMSTRTIKITTQIMKKHSIMTLLTVVGKVVVVMIARR